MHFIFPIHWQIAILKGVSFNNYLVQTFKETISWSLYIRKTKCFVCYHYYTFFLTKQYFVIQSTHKIWVSKSYSLFVIKVLEENVLTPQTRVIKAARMIGNCNKRHFIWSFSSIFKDLKVVLFHKVKTF